MQVSGSDSRDHPTSGATPGLPSADSRGVNRQHLSGDLGLATRTEAPPRLLGGATDRVPLALVCPAPSGLTELERRPSLELEPINDQEVALLPPRRSIRLCTNREGVHGEAVPSQLEGRERAALPTQRGIDELRAVSRIDPRGRPVAADEREAQPQKRMRSVSPCQDRNDSSCPTTMRKP